MSRGAYFTGAVRNSRRTRSLLLGGPLPTSEVSTPDHRVCAVVVLAALGIPMLMASLPTTADLFAAQFSAEVIGRRELEALLPPLPAESHVASSSSQGNNNNLVGVATADAVAAAVGGNR